MGADGSWITELPYTLHCLRYSVIRRIALFNIECVNWLSDRTYILLICLLTSGWNASTLVVVVDELLMFWIFLWRWYDMVIFVHICLYTRLNTLCLTYLERIYPNLRSHSRLILMVSPGCCIALIYLRYYIPPVRRATGDTWRFRVLIGNNGAMHFNVYPEPYNHAHLLHVYLWQSGYSVFQCVPEFTEFTDASMPPKTMLAWVSTGFRRIMPTITTDSL